jgi:hypothetical protein
MQQSQPILVRGRRVSALLEDVPRDIRISFERRSMQRTVPIIVLGYRVCPALDKQPCKVHIFPGRLQRPLQRSQPSFVPLRRNQNLHAWRPRPLGCHYENTHGN